LADAAVGERQQVGKIFGAHARQQGFIHREFRVKADIDAMGMIIKLEITDDRYARKHIAEVQQLAPAMMTDDHIGGKAERLHVGGDARDFFGANLHHLVLFHRLVDVA